MGVSISNQANVFLAMALCGCLVGIVFDLFRILRKFIKMNCIWVNITDVFFIVCCLCIVFTTLIYFNNGQLRWYEFLGLFLGTLLYFLCISKPIMYILTKIVGFLQKIVGFILKILLTPMTFLYRILVLTLLYIIRFFKRILKWIYSSIYGGAKLLMTKKHKKKKKSVKKVNSVFVIFVVLLGVMFVKGAMQQPKITENKLKIAALQEQLEYENNRSVEIDTLREKVNTDEYIEKVARDKLGLIKENERIFIDAAGLK